MAATSTDFTTFCSSVVVVSCLVSFVLVFSLSFPQATNNKLAARNIVNIFFINFPFLLYNKVLNYFNYINSDLYVSKA